MSYLLEKNSKTRENVGIYQKALANKTSSGFTHIFGRRRHGIAHMAYQHCRERPCSSSARKKTTHTHLLEHQRSKAVTLSDEKYLTTKSSKVRKTLTTKKTEVQEMMQIGTYVLPSSHQLLSAGRLVQAAAVLQCRAVFGTDATLPIEVSKHGTCLLFQF